jgi:citrate lyase subunit beta/citryl-CoA lyase
MAETSDPGRWRTVLFVPADRPEMLERAQSRGADAILVDLEDAIAPSGKAAAREVLRDAIASGSLAGPGAVCIRLNAVGEGFAEDLAAVAGSDVGAVFLPKAADAATLAEASAQIEGAWGGHGRIGLVPQVESACGVLAAADLLAVEGVVAIAFGGEDFCVDLGVKRGVDSLELLLPRAQLGLLASAARLPAIDTVYTAIDDEEGLVREARTARQLGFGGKLLIHPRQVEPVRRVFAPSEEDVSWAHRVLATAAEGDGAGVTVVDGRMVDAPVIAQAERILSRRG